MFNERDIDDFEDLKYQPGSGADYDDFYDELDDEMEFYDDEWIPPYHDDFFSYNE